MSKKASYLDQILDAQGAEVAKKLQAGEPVLPAESAEKRGTDRREPQKLETWVNFAQNGTNLRSGNERREGDDGRTATLGGLSL